MTSLRIAFAGTPQFALPALRALLKSSHQVVGVLTQPDRPAGRGQHLRASPVKLLAAEHRLPIAQPSTLKTPEGRAELAQWAPDVLVVVAYGLILPQAALDLPRLGCVNIHGSLLPRWRGAAPIHRAILAGDAETGVTIMQLDAGLDTGPMLLERSRSIGLHDTAGDLHDALAELGAVALIEALDGLAAGTLRPRAQPGGRDLRAEDREVGGHASTGRRPRFSSIARCARSIPGRSLKRISETKPCACCARAWPSRAASMPSQALC